MNMLIDNNELLGVAATFLTHVGARHLSFNFSAVQQRLIAHPISQVLIMSGMFYLSTRKITATFILTIVYYLLLFVLLNEKHPLNIIPRQWLIREGFVEASEKSPIENYYSNISRAW